MKICIVSVCNGETKNPSADYCGAHYQRQRKGQPVEVPIKRRPARNLHSIVSVDPETLLGFCSVCDTTVEVVQKMSTSGFYYYRCKQPQIQKWSKTYSRNTGYGLSFWVYTLYDGSGAVLYVGKTNNPSTRMSDHKRHQPWWDGVRTASWRRCNLEQEALDLEDRLIIELLPVFNIQGKPKQ